MDIENAGNVDRYAVAVAAQTARKPDGNYRRRGIEELAEYLDVNERTVRRIVSDVDLPKEPLYPLSHLADAMAALPEYSVTPEHTICVCLALSCGNAKIAHSLAKEQCGFQHSYRTFLRRIDDIHPAVRANAESGYKAAIPNMLYLSNRAPHRNHTWGIDSTMADVRVIPPRGHIPIRPYLTVVMDKTTSMMMAVLAAEEAPNATSISVALTMAAGGNMKDPDEEDFVGGLPVVVVFDNGKENLNNTVREGCLRLNLIATPTAPRHPWQNGSVERAHRTIRDNFLALLPGTMVGGENQNTKRRFTPDAAVDVQPGTTTAGGHELIHFEAFVHELELFRIRYNNTVGSDGLSPMQRWKADTTGLVAIDPIVMLAHMAKQDRLHTVNKAGIRFQGRDYVSAAIAPYRKRKVSVRFLPHVTDWIEIFDGQKYVGRAYRAETFPYEEVEAVMRERGQVVKRIRATDREARRIRDHIAHAINEGHEIVNVTGFTIEADATEGNQTEPAVIPRLNKKPPRNDSRKHEPSPLLEGLAEEFKRGESA